MNRDKSFLIEFLKIKIRKLEHNELSTSEFQLLRNYFLTTIIPEVSDDELKRYLFVGYYLLNSSDS
jgi:hypothetical protein